MAIIHRPVVVHVGNRNTEVTSRNFRRSSYPEHFTAMFGANIRVVKLMLAQLQFPYSRVPWWPCVLMPLEVGILFSSLVFPLQTPPRNIFTTIRYQFYEAGPEFYTYKK